MRSAPAIAAAVAAAVESARVCGPMPSAMALAIRAVFPHSDSYTTTAFTATTFPQPNFAIVVSPGLESYRTVNATLSDWAAVCAAVLAIVA
jgi:hypothetical protein